MFFMLHLPFHQNPLLFFCGCSGFFYLWGILARTCVFFCFFFGGGGGVGVQKCTGMHASTSCKVYLVFVQDWSEDPVGLSFHSLLKLYQVIQDNFPLSMISK